MRALAANSHAYASEGARLADEGDLAAAEARLRKVLAIRPGTATSPRSSPVKASTGKPWNSSQRDSRTIPTLSSC